jgi:hypothetical protein
MMLPKTEPPATDASVYRCVHLDATELSMQPNCPPGKAKRSAWFGLFAAIIFFLPMVVLPTLMLTFVIGVTLQAIGPQVHSLMIGVILLLWSAAAIGLLRLLWQVLWTTGYTTYRVDRSQRQLVVQTVNLLGRNYLEVIGFDEIRGIQLTQQQDSDSASVRVWLDLGQHQWGWITHPKQLIMSNYVGGAYALQQGLAALRYHRELLVLLRQVLGFSPVRDAD